MAQGIEFTGSDHAIEKRTFVDVFSKESPKFEENFEINFDLQIHTNTPIGYIIRIKENNQPPIYNLYYDEENNKVVFRLNEEGKSSLITVSFDRSKLKDQPWFSVRIKFDLINKQISLKIADEPEQAAAATLQTSYYPKIIFGKSDYMIDVPSMSIRSLHVGNAKNSFQFPMAENSGDLLHNTEGKAIGKVKNGIWLSNNAFHWKLAKVMYSATQAGSEYDPSKKSVYYFNKDSLQIFQLSNGENQTIRFQQPCPVKLVLGNSFIDTATNRMYVYETYYNTPYTGPTVASLDLSTFTWRVESIENLDSELNHHGYLFLSEFNKLFVFGGFGNMIYSNRFNAYDLAQRKWIKGISTRGDVILPRYFTSMGYSELKRKAYIFGGMGNESGQHIVGRKYFYDLYEFDPNNNIVNKKWDVNWKEKPFVPARGLVIPDSQFLYLMGYTEHLTHSFIKLRKFSLKDGQYEQLADSIPIYSDKISTRAKLFYDSKLMKLITIVQESDDDIHSNLSVYSLDFPAISESQLYAFPNTKKQNSKLIYYVICFGLLAVGCVGYRFFVRKSKKTLVSFSSFEENKNFSPEIKLNSICLFGDFTVIDKHGMDISHLFSTRLKQVFCLILFHSAGPGISSNLLSHLLWPEKQKDKAKTSRGVAINNLRKAISEIDGVEIIFEDGHFKVVFNEECYCDYQRLLSLLAMKSNVFSPEFTNIVERGQFLLGLDDALFDQAKADLENRLIQEFQQAISESLQSQNWDLLIKAAEMLIHLDPINEQALDYGLYAFYAKKNETKARLFYTRFVEQYALIMGENYSISFVNSWKKAGEKKFHK